MLVYGVAISTTWEKYIYVLRASCIKFVIYWCCTWCLDLFICMKTLDMGFIRANCWGCNHILLFMIQWFTSTLFMVQDKMFLFFLGIFECLHWVFPYQIFITILYAWIFYYGYYINNQPGSCKFFLWCSNIC